MVKITEELLRKKSEHNECMISTLEEVALHQENIERIENLQNWCRDLKILLLQSNLISKIENLYKLKRLEYLNLALNSIERIENLEELESLNKLDLTLNFIGEITSIESLKDNYNLKELILTGNPCCDYPHYREYVIGTLPQLDRLDCEEITVTQKLLAKKNRSKIRALMVQHQIKYFMQRDEQKVRVQQQRDELESEMSKTEDEEERAKLFWSAKTENCPEVRANMAQYHDKRKYDENRCITKKIEKKPPKLFTAEGRPYNLNQAKLDFSFKDEYNEYILDLQVFKFLDTSLIDVDVQVNYIRVTIKGKIFQIYLAEEVKIHEAVMQRSQTTGQLMIRLPKLKINENLILKNKEGILLLIANLIFDSIQKSLIGKYVSQVRANIEKSGKIELKGPVYLNDICNEFAGMPDLIED